MIDSTKFKHHLGDIVKYASYPFLGTIVGYYFLGGFNNYVEPYGYCVALLDGNVRTHSGESYGYHANGERINPIYRNKILYVSLNNCILVKGLRLFIYKLLLT